METTSADELAEALGCVERRTSQDPRTGEPHPPLEAIDCRIREMQLGLATYESPQQRDAVLDYLHEFSGYRTVGNIWIIAVNTPEAACVAKERLGGSVVALEGRREPDPYRPAPVTC